MVGTDTPLRITVIGAGVVGCYLGGRLARHADVTLVGRPHVLDPIRAVGLTVESGEGVEDRLHVPAEALTLAETPVAVVGRPKPRRRRQNAPPRPGPDERPGVCHRRAPGRGRGSLTPRRDR